MSQRDLFDCGRSDFPGQLVAFDPVLKTPVSIHFYCPDCGASADLQGLAADDGAIGVAHTCPARGRCGWCGLEGYAAGDDKHPCTVEAAKQGEPESR